MSDEYDPYAARGPARERPGKKIGETADEGEGPNTIAAGQLRAFCERYERLQEEKEAISDDQKEIMAEAKAMGWDVKTLRAVIRLRKQDPAERQEAAAMLELYMSALGME